jgi:hypothetical protein
MFEKFVPRSHMGTGQFPYVSYSALLTKSRRIAFVNIKPSQQSPQMWFCNACGERVTLAKQEKHAKDHR